MNLKYKNRVIEELTKDILHNTSNKIEPLEFGYTPSLHTYQNGDYTEMLYEDGTRVRTGKGVPKYPSSMDICITHYCNGYCPWCYEQSNIFGQHADLDELLNILEPLPAGTELAIGGGNPFAHPDLEEFLYIASSKGLICNITINEKHFPIYLDKLKQYTNEKLIYGVGYSYSKIPCAWEYEHLVTHLIIGNTHPENLDYIVSSSNKILLLGYKETGNGSTYKHVFNNLIEQNIAAWYRYLLPMLPKYCIALDNLAIKQLNPKRLFIDEKDYCNRYMGDDGEFTMYLDAVTLQYAVSSLSTKKWYFNGMDIVEAFTHVRKHQQEDKYI